MFALILTISFTLAESVETLNEVHTAQVLTYIKLSDCRVGLLINFNVKYLKDGLKSVRV